MFRPWRLAVVVAAASSLLAAGCSTGADGSGTTTPSGTTATAVADAPPVTDAPPQVGPRPITIIGDSISVGATDQYHRTMPLDDVNVEATIGIRLGGQSEAITEAVVARPDVLVIELGTNDLPVYEPAFLDEIDQVLDETNTLACVRWVTVYSTKQKAATAAVNDHLHEALAAHSNLQLVDWFLLVTDDPSLLSDDGLHPSDDGHAVLAQAVAAATSTCG